MRRLGEGLCWAGLFVLGACSSDNGSFADSGGGGGADATNADASTTSDAARDVTTTDGFTFDTSSTETSPSDSTTSSDTTLEASYSFDGFGYPDGYNAEAADCPDDDGDGFTVCDGDCDDHNSLVNPCAFDTNAASGDPVGSDGIDNDCDGIIDNLRLCDSTLTAAGHDTVASDYANASDICDNQATAANPHGYCQRVVSASWYGPNNSDAHRITTHMGKSFAPKLGSAMSFLSTGIADDDIDTPSYRTGDGTDLGNTFTNPYPFTATENTNPCGVGTAESSTTPAVHDYTELRLQLKAPINASGFSFMFNFFSEEYPVYVCAGFNDHFLALLTSKKYPSTTQISFDASGHPIDVNNSFFTDCTSVTTAETAGFPGPGTTKITGYNHTCTGALSLLTSTSYEIPYCCTGLTNGNDNLGSGATDWLTTTAPISAGETFTLSFIVFDEQDGILDSAINLDSFRWTSTPVSTPVTAR